MRIDDLLNKYFEGDTSANEEKEIRAFFAAGNIPEHLQSYQPLFAYFDEEIAKNEEDVVLKAPIKSKKPSIFYMISGIAAAMLLLLGIGQLLFFPGTTFCSGNYVVVNGRCYTDIHTIREYALNALQEVSSTPDEYFPLIEEGEDPDRIIIEEQFKELGNFFLDDEE